MVQTFMFLALQRTCHNTYFNDFKVTYLNCRKIDWHEILVKIFVNYQSDIKFENFLSRLVRLFNKLF